MTHAPKTLLIVDDEEAIHRALRRTLRREPYELLHAYDAAEAFAILERHPEIAGVLSDHYMPGTHGLDLLMEIRRRWPHVVTVLLTAQADLQLVISALNEGRIHRFFTKPWDAADLRQQLLGLLHGEGADPARDRDRETEERLREELMPLRDERTGAFLLDDSDFG